MSGQYSHVLCCNWLRWRAVGRAHLAVDLPAGNCTDMTGAIRIAQTLDPNVRLIETFVDDRPDVRYFQVGGIWAASYPQVAHDLARSKIFPGD